MIGLLLSDFLFRAMLVDPAIRLSKVPMATWSLPEALFSAPWTKKLFIFSTE